MRYGPSSSCGFIKGFTSKKSMIRSISVILIISFLNMTAGCTYYKVNTKVQDPEKNLKELSAKDKLFFVHYNDKAWILNNPVLDSLKLKGDLASTQGHEMYKKTRTGIYTNKYKSKEKEVLKEVHIYISQAEQLDSAKIAFDLSKVKQIDVYDRDIGTTVISNVLATAGIAAIAVVIFGIIVLLTKQSCPFVYVWDGQNYSFCGEIYSGAVNKAIERFDYLPLGKIVEQEGQYKIKISNEVKEIQHTNIVKLLLADHPNDCKVLIDKYGKIQTLNRENKPYSAVHDGGAEILDQLTLKDNIAFTGKTTGSGIENFVLKFDNPERSDKGKLIIRAKNSFWLDYVYGRFNGLFGSYYDKWAESQDNSDPVKSREWSLQQNIPLSVYVQKYGKWEFADFYNVAGPMAYKDDVLELDLKGAESPVSIMFQTGSQFWEIDYVAIDYSENADVTIYEADMLSAVNEHNTDIKELLSKDDRKYYDQPDIGNFAVLTFKAPESRTVDRTAFLQTKGYYRILSDFDGIPDKDYLTEFEKPGRFTEYSMELLRNLNGFSVSK